MPPTQSGVRSFPDENIRWTPQSRDSATPGSQELGCGNGMLLFRLAPLLGPQVLETVDFTSGDLDGDPEKGLAIGARDGNEKWNEARKNRTRFGVLEGTGSFSHSLLSTSKMVSHKSSLFLGGLTPWLSLWLAENGFAFLWRPGKPLRMGSGLPLTRVPSNQPRALALASNNDITYPLRP